MSELELRGKNHRVACHKTKRLVYKLNPRRHREGGGGLMQPLCGFSGIYFLFTDRMSPIFLYLTEHLFYVPHENFKTLTPYFKNL